MTTHPRPQGYRIVYRPGRDNPCPACSRENWYVGRKTAECAFCCAVVPLAGSMDVRMAIVARIKGGELSLEQGQAELARIKRNAKRGGKITRNQAWLGR